MPINSTVLEDIFNRLGLAWTKETSASYTERHGQSCSVYYRLDFGVIRLSDHDDMSDRMKLDYGTDALAAEVAVRSWAGIEIPAPMAEEMAAHRAEQKARREEAYAALVEAEAAERVRVDGVFNAMLEIAGHSGVTGRRRRQLVAQLKSHKGRRDLLGDRAKEFRLVGGAPYHADETTQS